MFRKLLIASFTLPYGLSYLGAALNQLVIIANHGKFPVMINPAFDSLLRGPDGPGILADGMIDEVHCVMSASTHLNYLADIFNFHHGILSIGDLLIDAGNNIEPYCLGFFLCLVLFLVTSYLPHPQFCTRRHACATTEPCNGLPR